MKKLSYSLILITAIGLTACGSKQNETRDEDQETSYDYVDDTLAYGAVADVATAEEGESSSADSAKIDKMLDDYEALINEYDKYLTKLKSGNVDMESAMNMASKAESMQSNLESYEANMSVAQTKRLSKLISKFTSIAAKAASVNVEDIQSVNGVNLKDLGL